MAMASATTRTGSNANKASAFQRSDGIRSFCSWTRNCAIALCVVGLLVTLLEVWVARAASPGLTSQSNPGQDYWPLQPLIGGNLAILLFWVWLDALRTSDTPDFKAARFNLWLVAAFVVFLSRILCLGLAGVSDDRMILPLTLFLALPTVTLVTVALWLAARRISSLALRTVILAGVAAAGSYAQQALSFATSSEPELGIFTRNSCLIGLALIVWLLVWAAAPETQRTA